MRILHFADAHIDIATHGRHDAETGLAIRTLDFLKALDTIVDTAIEERVDLVIFAGDAYRDRTPVPTYQREWGKRMMRLSKAGIPTLLLVGNHDLSPASGRAHALQEYETLAIPHIYVASRPAFYPGGSIDGLPVQVIALPWVNRSGFMASQAVDAVDPDAINESMEARLQEWIGLTLDKLDPAAPAVLASHATVQGATYGGERSVMLGRDLVLSPALLRDERLDYVALGHIHLRQNLDEGGHHPIIYPGSIERVDFGEAGQEKFFVIADVRKDGQTRLDWRRLAGRKFIDKTVELLEPADFESKLASALPSAKAMRDAVVRLIIAYPFEYESLLDEAPLREQARDALEFHLLRRPQREARIRIPAGKVLASLTPLELLEMYWLSMDTAAEEIEPLQALAGEVIRSAREGEE